METITLQCGELIEVTVVPILGDGNCCFRALSYLLYGDTERHFEVRKKIANFIVTRWNEYAIRTIDENGNSYSNPDIYNDLMNRSGTFGSACEVQAAAQIFNGYCFEIYWNKKFVVAFGDGEVKRMKFTGNAVHGHFDVYENVLPILATTTDDFCKRIGRPKKKKPGRKNYLADVKNSESAECRKEKNRIRMQKYREAEHVASKTKRLEVNKNRMRESRKLETPEHRQERLLKANQVSKTILERETDEKREKRLLDMKKRSKDKTDSETQERREKRLKILRKNAEIRIKNETEEDRETRLGILRKNAKIRSENETEEDRKTRLEIIRKFSKVRIQNETEKEREKRKNKRRELSKRRSLWNMKKNSAFNYDVNIEYDIDSDIAIGKMNIVCKHCKALKWKEEALGLCCSNGKIMLENISQRPEPLHSLIHNSHPKSTHFLNNIRKYNTAFQMTSLGCNRIMIGNFNPTFKIQGQVYHLIGSLLPHTNQEPKFLQIYFLGSDEMDIRSKLNPGLDMNLLKSLQDMLHKYNNYINSFKTILDDPNNQAIENFNVVIHADKKPLGGHRGQFNAPTVDEVAILITGQNLEKRDIILKCKDDSLQRISEIHRSYDALQYPLMFPRGEDGYKINLKQTDGKKNISAMNFYSFRLMARDGDNNSLLHYRQLLNQFITDMYVKIETERLNFIRHNQSKLRVDEYVHLRDAMANDSDVNNIGRPFILPSSFTGSPRYMQEKTQDAMTYVRKYGKPQLFITFTCNSKWDEITNELSGGQKSYDRQDIISRVFNLKVKSMMKLLTKGEIFGPVRCNMYTIEWQKRGLPHVHILLWLEQQVNPNKIDTFISAELPDPREDSILFAIVSSNMIHGPCGAFNPQSPCMKDGKCTKRFPKRFLNNTQTGDDGYPSYRRRSPVDGGIAFEKLIKKNKTTIDNRWVVPYCPLLCRTFKAHINVEFCNSVKSIKYICKYINKGSDQATFTVQNKNDEIVQYQIGRYVSSSEAVWRILSFPIHNRYPAIVHLAVHLENGQRVYFDPNNMQINGPPTTTLTAFFELCKTDNFAKTLLYCDVPSFYTFNNKKFIRRKQGDIIDGYPGIRKSSTIGRVYTVHPNNAECYFLRMLLHQIRGPTCFEDLRTVDGNIYINYRSACKSLGLLEDDQHWKNTLTEAAINEHPHKIRQLFVVMLLFCEISDPLNLWMQFRDILSEDIMLEAKRKDTNITYNENIYNQCLFLIDKDVQKVLGKRIDIYRLPLPNVAARSMSLYASEHSYDLAQLKDIIDKNECLLVGKQKYAYNSIMESIDDNLGKVFFLDAPGGTGKTFLINILLAKVRHSQKIALAVASSGIAATLLDGGRTAHSTFKLPLNLLHIDDPICNIKRGTDAAKVLQECALIVWDECTMSPKAGFEALDRTLRDLRDTDKIMGGLTVVLSGDFRQILPVVPRGTRADEVQACLKSSVIWREVNILKLTVNMRVQLRAEDSDNIKDFSELLLNIGNGNIKYLSEYEIEIPEKLSNLVSNLDDLILKIYPGIEEIERKNSEWFCGRSILTPKNETADLINNKILDLFTADEKTYLSVDTMVDPDEAVNYPIEFLNSLQPTGMPNHKLRLKVGTPIICLRNLNPPILCNGTRLQIIKLMHNIIEAIILTGKGKGETVFIPRIPLIPTDYPFNFKRLQFPVKVCFAMTINKAQGQSIKYTGIDLSTPCFSHGQFYVACSRVSSPDNLFIYSPTNRTSNVVYKEIFN